MEHYIVYDKNTGEERSRGQGPENAALIQRGMLPEHLSTMVVSLPVFNSYPLDLEKILASAALQIDVAAENVRLRFVSNGAGMALTYREKVDEAKAYIKDSGAAVPFLEAEANAIGSTVAELADEVLRRAAEWTVVGSRIEGKRMGAKAALGAASNLAQIADAMLIDWSVAAS